MSLDATRLGGSIKNAILALPAGTINDPITGAPTPVTIGQLMSSDPVNGIDSQTMLTNVCKAIAEEVISEITTNGKLQITVATHVHSGGTLGGGLTGIPEIGPTATEYGNPPGAIS